MVYGSISKKEGIPYMTIEVALLLSAISVSFGVVMGLSNMSRNRKTDTRQEVSEMTTVIVGLESIKDLVKEVKLNMSNMEKDLKEQGNNQIRIDEAFRSLVERVKNLEDRKG